MLKQVLFIIAAAFLIFFIPSNNVFCQNEADNLQISTMISVYEGRVAAFSYTEALSNEELAVGVKTGDIQYGYFLERIGEDAILVDIWKLGINDKAYIPAPIRNELNRLGWPAGIEVLLKKEVTKEANWTVIAIAYLVKKGYAYKDVVVEKGVKKKGITERIVTEIIKGEIKLGEESYHEPIEEEIIEPTPEPEPPPEPTPEPIPEEGPAITTSSLPSGTENCVYSAALEATGGTTPYVWKITSGSLPGGLSLGTDGVISGTPQTGSAGAYSFTVKVTDANGNSDTKGFQLTINVSTLSITTSSLPTGTKNSAYSTTLEAEGGTTPYTWSRIDGDDFPEGISLAGSTGKISGTPTEYGDFTFTVQVEDDAGNKANKEFTLEIAGIPVYDWTQSNKNGFGNKSNAGIFSLITFNSYIYAGTCNYFTGCELWRSPDGSKDSWTQCNVDGFGDDHNWGAKSLTTFNSYIYAGTRNDEDGCELWRSSGGELPLTWEQVNTDGFGDASNQWIESLTTFDGYIYAGTWNDAGCELWRSEDGEDWTQCNEDGFGDDHNWGAESLTTFNSYIYAGTRNDEDGCELWRFNGTESYDPHIHGRVYDSVTGETVDDCYVSLYRYKDNRLMVSSNSGNYSFNVDYANYYLRVEKGGYTFPSQVIEGTTAGDHGEVFSADEDEYSIDLPIDQGYPLQITKTSNKKKAMVGDIITFNISIKNPNSIAYNNIQIRDQILAGFKYVGNSTYLGNNNVADPASSGYAHRGYLFPVGTIGSNTTLNLSYQVRVSTGLACGVYDTTALAWNSYRDWRMSLDSEYDIRIIEDPLFTRGTIIGKVFWDVNSNGIQDHPPQIPLTGESKRGGSSVASATSEGGSQHESGIAGIRIATEYGVIVTTDDNGMYHIADVPPGRHLLKIVPGTIPAELIELAGGAIGYSTDNPYLVEITEGLLAKVNFGLGLDSGLSNANKTETKEIDNSDPIPDNSKEGPLTDFFIVALGELEVRDVDTSGNLEMIEQDDRFDEGINVDGKLVCYLKGKVLGKYLITATIDTTKRGGIGSYAKRSEAETKLLTNLDPDKYYPVYGDASKVDYSASDSQDMLYLLVEWDESYIKYGAIETDMQLYNRTMHGGKVYYKSTGVTKYDQPKTEIKAFFADGRQLPSHDEFLGTGGSLYYLRHQWVVEGSQKVKVVIKDQLDHRVMGTKLLEEEVDYTIDYDKGRILLTRPLSMVDYTYGGLISSTDILSGNRVFLEVDYEYISDKLIHREAWGGSAGQWLGDHIKVSGTYVSQENEVDHYDIKGGKVLLKVDENTEVEGEYNRSRNTQLGGNISADAGLNFTQQKSNYAEGKQGDFYGIRGKTRMFGNTFLEAKYIYQDPYYSATDTLSTSGTKRLTLSAVTYLLDNLRLGIKHATQILIKNTDINSSLTGDNKTHTTTAIVDWEPGKWDLRGEYQHQMVSKPIEDYNYFGSQQLKTGNTIAARAGYQFNDDLHAYIGGQGSLTGYVNNQGFVGADVRVMETIELNLKETFGNNGDGTLIGLTAKDKDGSEFYTSITVGNNDQFGQETKTSYGRRDQLGDKAAYYLQHDYSSYNEGIVEGNVLGYEEELSDTLCLGVSYERNHVYNDSNVIDRDSVSVKLGCLNIDNLNWNSSLEYREDSGSESSRNWLTVNDILWKVTPDITFIGKCNYSISKGIDTEVKNAQFKEIGLGLAYRPVRWDKLNILCKYNRREDLSPESQDDFPLSEDTKKDVFAVEGAYDLNRFLQLVGKGACRLQSEKIGPRDWTDSDTYLYLGRVNVHVTRKLSLAGEYRMLKNTDIKDSKAGWLAEASYELFKYSRVGIGYNFTDYNDDLTDNDDYDAKGWFVRMIGKY